MSVYRIPFAYRNRQTDWLAVVEQIAFATSDNPRVVADRMTRYVDTYAERYGRAPELDALDVPRAPVALRVAS